MCFLIREYQIQEFKKITVRIGESNSFDFLSHHPWSHWESEALTSASQSGWDIARADKTLNRLPLEPYLTLILQTYSCRQTGLSSEYPCMFHFSLSLNLHSMICLLILEIEGGRKGGREGGRDRDRDRGRQAETETSVWEKLWFSNCRLSYTPRPGIEPTT